MNNRLKFIPLLLIIPLLFSHTACGTKEYSGKKIANLTFQTHGYLGGYTKEDILNLKENTFSRIGYELSEAPETKLTSTFTEEEEKLFLDLCYTNGLFNIKDKYEDPNVLDGGEWTLTIEYDDGTKKISRGINDGPYKIFNKCSTAFYDLCGVAVVGTLPAYYADPPNVSWSFDYNYDNTYASTNMLAEPQRANYKWNKSQEEDADIFAINEAVKDKNKFEEQYDYKLVLFTANYRYEKKFKSLTVKEYDYNENLTNEKNLFEGKWIKQIELDIELNKIYVYEMTYANGDYVQFTFSTYCPETVDHPTE